VLVVQSHQAPERPDLPGGPVERSPLTDDGLGDLGGGQGYAIDRAGHEAPHGVVGDPQPGVPFAAQAHAPAAPDERLPAGLLEALLGGSAGRAAERPGIAGRIGEGGVEGAQVGDLEEVALAELDLLDELDRSRGVARPDEAVGVELSEGPCRDGPGHLACRGGGGAVLSDLGPRPVVDADDGGADGHRAAVLVGGGDAHGVGGGRVAEAADAQHARAQRFLAGALTGSAMPAS